MKKLLLFLFLAVAAGSLSAEVVAEDAETVSFRQPDGAVVKLHRNPRRTVLCFASLAQIWYAAGGTAVGVPQVRSKEALPEPARGLPTIGGAFSPNPEKVLSLKPDLVLLSDRQEKNTALAQMLNRAGVETVLVEYGNYADFAGLLDFFCRLNGTKASELPEAKRITEEVEAVCREVSALPKPSAAIVFAATAGFKLESEQSNTGTMLKMLGGRNIASGIRGSRAGFSFERLLVEDPDVIFVVTMGDAGALREKFRREIMSLEAWKVLKAAKTERVHFLPAELFLYQPGTRYPEAFRYLAKLLYPEREEK